MESLYKHPLNFAPAIKYLEGALEATNILSINILNKINPSNGSFFTLLPKTADASRIYHFESFILQQPPLIGYNDGSKAKYQIIPTIRDELSDFIIRKARRNEKLHCIFDDYNSQYVNGYKDELYETCGLHYQNEVYYSINKKNITKSILLDCLNTSNTFWHSLCVLTEANIDLSFSRELTLEKIQEICLKVKMVIVGAYDGEGYIFWEPN